MAPAPDHSPEAQLARPQLRQGSGRRCGAVLRPTAGQAVSPPGDRRAEREDGATVLQIQLSRAWPHATAHADPATTICLWAVVPHNWKVPRRLWCELRGRHVDPPTPEEPPRQSPGRPDHGCCLTASSARGPGTDHVHTTQPHTIAAVLSEDRVRLPKAADMTFSRASLSHAGLPYYLQHPGHRGRRKL